MKFVFVLFIVGLANCAPATWQEHWGEHKQLMTKVFENNDVVIYFDPDMDKNIKWMNQYLTDVWVYVKKTYGGNFGDDNKLYANFHKNKYGGGHPSTSFDESHDFHNTIDCGNFGDRAWTAGAGNDLDMTTHEVGHIVEGGSFGVKNSPAFPLWRDSKWMEIMIYDVYKGLNRQEDVRRWRDLVINGHEDFPRANTYWFRDWFLPIYERHGGTQALRRFFELLSQNFPKNNGAARGRPQYSRDMNWGEFVHFWSGAANTNLKDLATKAFGWPNDWNNQFEQARRDFPNVRY